MIFIFIFYCIPAIIFEYKIIKSTGIPIHFNRFIWRTLIKIFFNFIFNFNKATRRFYFNIIFRFIIFNFNKATRRFYFNIIFRFIIFNFNKLTRRFYFNIHFRFIIFNFNKLTRRFVLDKFNFIVTSKLILGIFTYKNYIIVKVKAIRRDYFNIISEHCFSFFSLLFFQFFFTFSS